VLVDCLIYWAHYIDMSVVLLAGRREALRHLCGWQLNYTDFAPSIRWGKPINLKVTTGIFSFFIIIILFYLGCSAPQYVIILSWLYPSINIVYHRVNPYKRFWNTTHSYNERPWSFAIHFEVLNKISRSIFPRLLWGRSDFTTWNLRFILSLMLDESPCTFVLIRCSWVQYE